MTFLMLFVSPAPQNCVRKVEQPVQKPKTIIHCMLKSCTPRLTADSAVSERLLTIILSSSVSELLISPCSATGTAIIATFL